MILYTMMPQEFIYPISENDYNKQKIVDINGVSLIVEETSLRNYQVIRVLSTNPNDFLNDLYTPGNKVNIIQS